LQREEDTRRLLSSSAVSSLFLSGSNLFFLKWLKGNIALFRGKKGSEEYSGDIKNQKEKNGRQSTAKGEGNIVEKEAYI
jgi:hypothetical protein